MRVTLIGLLLALAVGTVIAGPPSALPEQLLGHYYFIQKKLASDTTDGIAASAAKLADISRRAAQTDTRSGAQLTALAQAAAKLQTTDLKTARNGFGAVSNRLIAYLQAAEAKRQPPYQFYCPMVKQNWLQPDKDIRNPYYGSSMLKCGELVQSDKAPAQSTHH